MLDLTIKRNLHYHWIEAYIKYLFLFYLVIDLKDAKVRGGQSETLQGIGDCNISIVVGVSDEEPGEIGKRWPPGLKTRPEDIWGMHLNTIKVF